MGGLVGGIVTRAGPVTGVDVGRRPGDACSPRPAASLRRDRARLIRAAIEAEPEAVRNRIVETVSRTSSPGPTVPAAGLFRSARNDASLAAHEAAVIFSIEAGAGCCPLKCGHDALSGAICDGLFYDAQS